MSGYYIPYSGKKPKVFSINGHRFILLSDTKEGLEDQMIELGADKIRKVRAGYSLEEQTIVFQKLAKNVNASVVVASDDIKLEQIIDNLGSQLPWVH